MHTVDLLEQALGAARLLGYSIREEWLGGSGGGGCEVKGRKWLFLDLAQDSEEHLQQVLDTIRRDAGLSRIELPQALRERLAGRYSARG